MMRRPLVGSTGLMEGPPSRDARKFHGSAHSRLGRTLNYSLKLPRVHSELRESLAEEAKFARRLEYGVYASRNHKVFAKNKIENYWFVQRAVDDRRVSYPPIDWTYCDLADPTQLVMRNARRGQMEKMASPRFFSEGGSSGDESGGSDGEQDQRQSAAMQFYQPEKNEKMTVIKAKDRTYAYDERAEGQRKTAMRLMHDETERDRKIDFLKKLGVDTSMLKPGQPIKPPRRYYGTHVKLANNKLTDVAKLPKILGMRMVHFLQVLDLSSNNIASIPRELIYCVPSASGSPSKGSLGGGSQDGRGGSAAGSDQPNVSSSQISIQFPYLTALYLHDNKIASLQNLLLVTHYATTLKHLTVHGNPAFKTPVVEAKFKRTILQTMHCLHTLNFTTITPGDLD